MGIGVNIERVEGHKMDKERAGGHGEGIGGQRAKSVKGVTCDRHSSARSSRDFSVACY